MSNEDKAIELIGKLEFKKYYSDKICPYCKSKNFYSNFSNYICQDCNESGDAVSYLMAKKYLSYDEAIKKCFKELKGPNS